MVLIDEAELLVLGERHGQRKPALYEDEIRALEIRILIPSWCRICRPQRLSEQPSVIQVRARVDRHGMRRQTQYQKPAPVEIVVHRSFEVRTLNELGRAKRIQ